MEKYSRSFGNICSPLKWPSDPDLTEHELYWREGWFINCHGLNWRIQYHLSIFFFIIISQFLSFFWILFFFLQVILRHTGEWPEEEGRHGTFKPELINANKMVTERERILQQLNPILTRWENKSPYWTPLRETVSECSIYSIILISIVLRLKD